MNAIVADMDLALANAAAYFAAAGLCGAPAPPQRGQPDHALDGLQFHGDFERGPLVTDGAQATYEGVLVANLLDRALVEQILPPTIGLARPVNPLQTLHPIVYLLGRQSDTCLLNNGHLTPAGKPYNELILLVPYVVHAGVEDRWHNFAARMYLDDAAATLIGDFGYAYAKEIGEFTLFGAEAEVGMNGNVVLQNDVTEASAWMDEAQAKAMLPGFADARQILDMPIIGVSNICGRVRSYFEWDCSNAQIAAADSVHRFDQAFRPGMQPWVDLGFLANAPHAAFKLRKVCWRLSTTLPDQHF